MAGADTTLKNAIRDGAQFAWIPHGDTCPFCITLASRGWQYASKKALKYGHAEHIHPHCDCQYATRFSSNTNVAGYDPDKYLEMYNSAEGRTPDEKINSMRRMQYASRKDMINAQRREAYAKKKDVENKEKSKKVIDVTEEYLKNSKPGSGKEPLFLNGTKPDEMRDRETATWLHDTFGGYVICLPEESEKGKNPDSLWEGIYWEFKKPTSKTAIDDRLKYAKKQIVAAQERDGTTGEKCGIILNITDSTISREETIKTIENRFGERFGGKFKEADLIIRYKNNVEKVLRVK